jgi:hypothetical protein
VSAAATSGQTNFTPGRENAHDRAITELLGLITKPPGVRYHFGWQNGKFVEDDASGPYSESALRRADVAEARELDRDSRKGLVLWWNSTDGFDLDHFERVGRRFARQLAVDGLAQMVGVERGAALTAKPDEELRRKIRLFKDIQATREAAFEFT